MSAPYFGPCPSNLVSQWIFSVNGGSGLCSDITNGVAWLNEQSAPPWEVEHTGTFNTPASVVPDSSGSSGLSGGPGGDINFNSSWGTNGSLIKTAVLANVSTVMLVAYWFDDSGNYGPQQSCVYSGVAAPCGASSPSYIYNVPVPSLVDCSSVNYATLYQIWDAAGWEEFVEDCPLNPNCHASLTPGPCLSGDPFFGDDAP